MDSLHQKTGWFAILIFTCVLGAEASFAQKSRSFDAESYFERLDRNGDDRLDANELNPKAAAYLRRIGVDTDDDRISLRSIKKRIERKERSDQEQREEQGNTKQELDLKVPGFGVPVEESAVDGFGTGSPEAKVEFSDSTVDMTNSVLRRYDRNGDNMIDEYEIRRGNWGRPDPKESDLNKDGSLSRNELLTRYHLREKERSRSRNDSDRGDSRSDRGRSERDRDRGDRYNKSPVSNRKTASSSSSQTKSSSNRSSSQRSREAYEKYSKSLIKRYDKDKDNRLSKEEWKSVRSPPANADKNRDGFVSQKEYATALMEAADGKPNRKVRGSSSGGVQATTASHSSGRGGKSVGVKKTSNKKSGDKDLAKLDSNSDSQVQMHEYSTSWDDKKLEEFYKIDKNRDGVITQSEWQAR